MDGGAATSIARRIIDDIGKDGAYELLARAHADDLPQELAQNSSQAQADIGDPVGKVETIKGAVTVTRTDGTKVKAATGLEIFQGDVVETEGKSSVGIVFADNSTFSLADEGQMTIDEMVYDPGGQEGSAALSVTQGIFTFVSGQISKSAVDAMTITTPTSTIGIRGTSLAAKVGSPKGDVFTLLADQDAPPGAPGIPSGEITLTNGVGSQTLNQPNATSSVTSAYSSPTRPVILPNSVVNKVFGSAISVAQQTITASGGTANTSGGDQQGGGATTEGGTESAAGTEPGAEPGTEGEAPPEGETAADAAFTDALESGGDLETALTAATDTIAETGLRTALANDPNVFGTPNAIESAMGGIVSEAMGGLGSEARDPLDPGTGNQNAGGADDPIGSGGEGGAGTSQLDPGGGQTNEAGGGPAPGELGPLDPLALFDPLAGLLDPLSTELPPPPEPVTGPEDDPPPPPPPPPDTTTPTVETSVGPGSDSFTFVASQHDIVSGSTTSDTITAAGVAEDGDTFDGGTGSDHLTFSGTAADSGSHSLTVLNTESITLPTGASGTDFNLNIGDDQTSGIDLGTDGIYTIDGSLADGGSQNQSWTINDSSTSNTVSLLGGQGNDKVTLGTGDQSIAQLSDVETLALGNGTNTLTLTQVTGTIETLTGGTAVDTVNLGNSGVTADNITAVESITGGAGADTVTITDSTAVSIDGGGGGDVIAAGGGADTLLGGGGADTMTGGSGSDTFSFGAVADSAAGGGDTITDFDAGTSTTSTDKLFLDGLKTGSFSFIGASAFSAGGNSEARFDDTSKVLYFDANGDGVADMEITLTGVSLSNLDGTDFLVSGSGDVVANVSGTDSYTFTANNDLVIGSTGSDTVTFSGTAASGDSFDGQGGTDNITLSTGNDVFEVKDINSVSGGSGTDTITLADSGTTTFFADVETITGGTGGDAIRFAAASGTVTIDGGGGTDSVNPNNGGTWSFHLTNVESIPGGGAGADTITLLNAQTSTLSVRLGGGGSTDTLNLANGGNLITMWEDVEVINGGTGADVLTAETTLLNDITQFSGSRTRQYALGGGEDTVTMSAGADGIAVSGVETIFGLGGADRIALLSGGQTITHLDSVETVKGGTGNDSITLAGGGQTLSDVSAVETIIGGSGADSITISDSTASTITGGGGADTITGSGAADRYVFSGSTPAGLGTDSITNFSGATAFGGAGGESDVLTLDSSDLGLATITYEEVSWDGTSGAITLSDITATVIVLHGIAGTQADAAAAIAAGNSTSASAVFLFNDSANANTLTMAHTDDANNNGTESNLATFSNNTTATDTDDLDAADFTLTA